MSILRIPLAPSTIRPPTRDPALEGLRGAAALAVLYAHLTSPMIRPDGGGVLDPAYSPSPIWWWFQGGSLAVLIFFLLSGHVIGLSLLHPFSKSDIPSYFRRRAVRILPIYLVAVALGLAASPEFPLGNAVGHLIFLQSDGPSPWIALLPANPSLWSLAYEAVFYLVFPLLWIARPPLGLTLLASAALCALPKFWPSFPSFPAALFGGLAVWIVGLASAWMIHPSTARTSTNQPWPSLLLLALATWQIDPGTVVLRRLGLDTSSFAGFELQHYASIPVLWCLLLIIAQRTIPCPRLLASLCWGIPGSVLAWRCAAGSLPQELWVPSGFFAGAGLLRNWSPGLGFWRWLAPVGAISYGLYAIAFPLQVIIRSSFPAFSGSALTWFARLSVTVALAFACASLLERRLQPRINAIFR
jgi:peptidoglycan/LPS O-acetylase OafA/YrhL